MITPVSKASAKYLTLVCHSHQQKNTFHFEQYISLMDSMSLVPVTSLQIASTRPESTEIPEFHGLFLVCVLFFSINWNDRRARDETMATRVTIFVGTRNVQVTLGKNGDDEKLSKTKVLTKTKVLIIVVFLYRENFAFCFAFTKNYCNIINLRTTWLEKVVGVRILLNIIVMD